MFKGAIGDPGDGDLSAAAMSLMPALVRSTVADGVGIQTLCGNQPTEGISFALVAGLPSPHLIT